MNKQTLHILHVYFSQIWELSSIIYSLLFLFYINLFFYLRNARELGVRVMMSNATFNNILAKSWP